MPKRKLFTVHEKLQILDRIRNGETRTRICKEFGLAESTLRGWIKEEDKLRSFADTVDGPDALKRKRAKTAQDPALDSGLYDWFVKARADGVPVSGPIALQQDEKIAQQLHGPDHTSTPTRGFIQRWKE